MNSAIATDVIVVHEPTADAGFRGLSAARLSRMSLAGSVVILTQRLFQKTGDNVVGEVLRGQDTFTEWNHYPDGDVYDPESHAQYYYHAHPPEGRPLKEHGHFHLFLRAKGMPRGMKPLPGQPTPKDGGRLSHLVAISMDNYGTPIRLFTTNRWVTGDVWYAADDVVRMLDLFSVEVVRPNLAVNRWISAMIQLFYPQIVNLLKKRDAAIEAWRRSHPGVDVFEDRGLEVTSSIDISVDEQVARISDVLRSAPDEASDA